MAGGIWTTQNKVRPGVYIRFQSNSGTGLTVGQRGTVAICEPMSWGPVGQVMTIEAGADTTPYCGYDITNSNAMFLREIFKGTNVTGAPTTVLLYRPSADSAVQATATISPLTATALYPGVRGNDISIAITALTEPKSSFLVTTMVDGDVVDEQTAAQVSDLVANEWVTFSGNGALSANTGTALTNGADGTVQDAAYSTFLTNIEPYQFDILIYDGNSSTVQTAMTSFVQRMCEENGQWCQLVASGLTNPDSQYVINNEVGVILSDGTTLTPQQVTWWLGGAEAGANYNESLTYAQYPGAVDVSPKLTNSQIIDGINSGELILFEEFGVVKVETDINSLVTYTPDTGKIFRKNRVMRLCSSIANDIYQQFSASYIGRVNNNTEGQALFKSAIVGYMLQLQGAQAIQNFSADDVEVSTGSESDSIVVNIAVQAVNSVEKVYMTVTVS